MSDAWTPNTMRWRGEWEPDLTYLPGDTVRQSGWTMICANYPDGCTDAPAPYPTGDPVWWWTGAVPSTNVPTSDVRVVYGMRYTMPASGYITLARYYADETDPDISYQPTIVFDPLGPDPFPIIGATQIPTQAGWRNVVGEQILFPAGAVVDVMITKRDQRGNQQSWAAPWDYKRQNGTANEKEAWHASNGREISFHETDANEVDQGTNLAAVQLDDTIAGGGMDWRVTSTEDEGTAWRYGVEPSNRISNEGQYTFTFTRFTDGNVSYVREDGAAPAGSQGFAGVTYDPAMTLDNNQYGIDIQVQQAVISPEWDAVAFP